MTNVHSIFSSSSTMHNLTSSSNWFVYWLSFRCSSSDERNRKTGCQLGIFSAAKRIMLSHINLCPCRAHFPFQLQFIFMVSVSFYNGSWGMSRNILACAIQFAAKLYTQPHLRDGNFWIMSRNIAGRVNYSFMAFSITIFQFRRKNRCVRKRVHLFWTEIKKIGNLFDA